MTDPIRTSPSADDTVPVRFRLPRDQHNAIVDAARSVGLSRNDFMVATSLFAAGCEVEGRAALARHEKAEALRR